LYNNHHDNNTLSNSTPKRLGHLAPKTMATLMRMSTSNEEEEEQQRERESEREGARREEGSREGVELAPLFAARRHRGCAIRA